MRGVVTGGAGFIGSHVVDALLARGDEAHVVDNLSSGKRENLAGGAVLHETDIRSDLRQLFDELSRDFEVLVSLVRQKRKSTEQDPVGKKLAVQKE